MAPRLVGHGDLDGFKGGHRGPGFAEGAPDVLDQHDRGGHACRRQIAFDLGLRLRMQAASVSGNKDADGLNLKPRGPRDG